MEIIVETRKHDDEDRYHRDDNSPPFDTVMEQAFEKYIEQFDKGKMLYMQHFLSLYDYATSHGYEPTQRISEWYERLRAEV